MQRHDPQLHVAVFLRGNGAGHSVCFFLYSFQDSRNVLKWGWQTFATISNFPVEMMSRSESSCKKSPMEKVVPLRCLDRDYNGGRTCRRVRSLLPAKTTPQIANDPTARHLVPEDQQTALACDAQVRARHGLSLAFFAKHPAEPYRSRVGFSKLQIGSPVRSFFFLW